MSVLDRIIIDDEFLQNYWNGQIEVAEMRSAKLTILKTKEIVYIDIYPVLNALRKLNYTDNFTEEELKIFKKKG